MNASLDIDRIRAVGGFLKHHGTWSPTDWLFEGLPAKGDPHAVDYFFLAVKHQYGFWHDDGESYTEPMTATVGGRRFKGSDFVWHALRRSAARDPGIYEAARQAVMTDAEIAVVFSDDDGRCPLPMLDTHCGLWRGCAKDLLRLNLTPARIVESCRNSGDPVKSMMAVLAELGGYKEDPLAKKASLLVLILANRPERFLSTGPFKIAPIVDYHNMRSLLRIGMVRIDDPDLEARIRRRKILSGEEEAEIRSLTYDALLVLEKESGMGMETLDWFFFQNRRRCPEMTEPDCPNCEIQTVCARKKDLFQPVVRTTFY